MQFLSTIAAVAAAIASTLPIAEALPQAGATSCQANSAALSTARAGIVRSNLAARNAKVYNEKYNIIQSFNPDSIVNVAFAGKRVQYGNTFTTAQTDAAPNGPSIIFSSETAAVPSGTSYIVLFVDPDATSPSTPTLRSYVQWFYYGVSPCTTPENDFGFTEALSYQAPAPQSEAAHRYAVMVYRQPANFAQTLSQADIVRTNFNVTGFALKYKLGAPVALNYFLEGATA